MEVYALPRPPPKKHAGEVLGFVGQVRVSLGTTKMWRGAMGPQNRERGAPRTARVQAEVGRRQWAVLLLPPHRPDRVSGGACAQIHLLLEPSVLLPDA